MLHSGKQFRLLVLPWLGAVVLWLAGCAESERFTYATEADEPKYREGVALLKTGRKQEALAAFLKVIDKRGEDAAESHLEVGLLYQQHINDPLSAIYHFKKFLALRPNSPQASLVRQRIDAATRDFARTLPAQPLENQLQRVDLVAALDQVKQENASLKQEIARLRASRGLAASDPVVATETPVREPEVTTRGGQSVGASQAAASSEGFNFNVPVVRTRGATASAPPRTQTAPPPVAAAQPQPKANQPTTPAVKNAPTPAAGRRHVVRPGETLMQISLRYYGDRSRWRDIYAANRDAMRSETDLKVGMSIRIP